MTLDSRLALPFALLLACGPSGPSANTSDSAGETGETGETGPTLAWETVATTCGTAEAILVLPDDSFVVAGTSAIISGWLRRYSEGGDELWVAVGADPFVDLDWGPGDSLWVAAAQWGGSSSIAAYDLDGQALAGAPVLPLASDARLGALAKRGEAWLLGGRVGPPPEDAWLIEIDALGQTVAEYDAPLGNGNVGSVIASLAGDAGLAAACGTTGSGEWGFPWLLILAGDEQHEVDGEGNDGLGVRSCVDVAVAGERIARAERGEIDTIVVSDSLGAELWSAIEEGVKAVAFTPNADLVSATDTWLRRRGATGELIWEIPIDVADLSVRDLAAVADGFVVVGNLPSEVGECSEAWIGRYAG